MDKAGGQIQGARRRQEDAFAIEAIDEQSFLALVADGLGGLPAGNIASREAAHEFKRVFRERAQSGRAAPMDWLRDALMEADQHLKRRQKADPALAGMSTTLVALYARRNEAFALSVGDSYLMLLRDGTLYVLNELHRHGSALTSCLGLQLNQIHTLNTLKIAPGDRFLLATDGITTLREAAIRERLESAEDARTAVSGLLQAIEDALEAHQDNATVVAILVP